MRETTVPEIVAPPTTGGLADHIVENAHAEPTRAVLARRTDAGWSDVTAAQFLAEVVGVAKGLMAAGIEPGDRIGVMSRTRYEWTLVDYAIWYAGAVSVPIYETSSPEQVEWCLSDSGAVAVFLESERSRTVFAEVAGALPDVRRSWVFDEGATATLTAEGDHVSDADLEQRRETVTPGAIATIIYTSGTTGRPKGCELTHANFMFEVDNVIQGMPEVFLDDEPSTLLFLPVAHVFGRMIQVGCVRARVRMGHTADVKNLLPDLQSFRPTFVLSVPRVFEKIYNSAQQKATAEGKGRIFDAAAGTAIDYSRAIDSDGPGILLRLKHLVFDRLVYGKLRGAMGGNIRWAVSGGAPLGERLGHFFRGIGITILEGYGLTETAAASTVNRPSALRIGTVGQPTPGSAVRIAEDGEILLKGGHIFRGYWNNEDASAEALSADGWFHSGDIGEIDDQGFVRITGRKKELLVTAGGKNVAPAVLEDRLRASAIVSQCMVVGDNKPYIAALVTIDADAFPAWAKQHHKSETATIAELVDDPDLIAEVQSAVDDANRAVSQAEAIKRFRILSVDWTEEGGQLTPSMKLKRAIVVQDFSADVEALYAS